MPHPEADILLVQPPVHHPACYSTVLLRVAAVLQRDGHTIRRFHAGAGYFNYVVGNARVQADLQARVAERLQGGDDQEAEDRVRRKVQSRAAEICVAGLTFREDPALLKESPADPDWADLSESVRRLDGLDKVLDLVSAACHPARIDRRGCVWPGLDDEQALAAYLDDSQHNPFFDYAGVAEVPDIASGRCAAVAIVVSAPGQMVGGLTLARRWQRRWPTVAITVCAARKDWGTADERLWVQLRGGPGRRIGASGHGRGVSGDGIANSGGGTLQRRGGRFPAGLCRDAISFAISGAKRGAGDRLGKAQRADGGYQPPAVPVGQTGALESPGVHFGG